MKSVFFALALFASTSAFGEAAVHDGTYIVCGEPEILNHQVNTWPQIQATATDENGNSRFVNITRPFEVIAMTDISNRPGDRLICLLIKKRVYAEQMSR